MRFFQLNDNHSNDGEFYGIGYLAGAATGTNSSGGVYKDLYADGTTCSSTNPASCTYSNYVNKSNPISQGQTHIFQIQRVQINGVHVFRFWFDNSQVLDRNELMQSAAVSLGSERNFLPAYSSQTVNMAGDFTDINYHQYGDASSSPPGHLNYTRPSGIGYQFQHSGCSTTPVEAASGTYMYQVTTAGRC